MKTKSTDAPAAKTFGVVFNCEYRPVEHPKAMEQL
jgi:hypothetical protein